MTPQRATEILDAIQGKRILVVGDVMLDRYIVGTADRISAEVPVPIVDKESEHSSLGGAGNAAMNVAILGAQVTFLSVVGSDDAGAGIRNGKRHPNLREWWVFEDANRKTTVKTRIVANGHQVMRIDDEDRGGLSYEMEKRVCGSVEAAMNWADAVLVSDYAKGVVTETVAERVLDTAGKRKLVVVIDPKPEHWGRYVAWDAPMVMTPNTNELRAMAQMIRDETSSGPGSLDTDDALYVGVTLDALDVIETRGADGVWLHSVGPPSTSEHYEATTKNAVDVSGAGDTVSAVMAACVATHIPTAQAVDLANIAAGVAVRKPGCATVEPEEIIAACA